jgi:hypothetical protein
VSSGLWVLSIGVHTFVNLVLQKPIPMKAFVAWVISLWGFCLILTAVGPITHREDFFVPAGAWVSQYTFHFSMLTLRPVTDYLLVLDQRET